MIQDNYEKLKLQYPKSIIIIKAGNFYECINDDAIIMNNIFKYKIRKFSKYIRLGFPILSLNKVTGILTKLEINYIIVEDGSFKKEKFKHNNYNEYSDKIIDYKWAEEKIEYINRKLKDNITNSNIVYILNEMEKILCKINF